MKFCECIALSMNGDIFHKYAIKTEHDYLDNDTLINHDINYLELKEKQKLKVIYDYKWTFNVTVSKINDNYRRKRFEVLSGKGLGITKNCSSEEELKKIYSEDNPKYNINEFNLDEINDKIDMYF